MSGERVSHPLPAGRIYLGTPGHFIAAERCRFRLHTRVGNYRISTVGEYYPWGRDGEKPETVGLDRLYETMVFPLGADGEPTSWEGIDFGGYQTAAEAQRGHEELVAKYELRTNEEKKTEGSNG